MKKPSMKNFLREIYNNNKTKSENTMILCILIAHVKLLACVPVQVCAIAHASVNSMFY